MLKLLNNPQYYVFINNNPLIKLNAINKRILDKFKIDGIMETLITRQNVFLLWLSENTQLSLQNQCF